jgi:hypothetical protein
MKDQTLYNIYTAALALNIPNEFLSVVFVSDTVITIACKMGGKWDARTTMAGKIRISTLRPAW